MTQKSDDDASRQLSERYDREAYAYLKYWAPVLLDASRRLIREPAMAGVRRILDLGAGAGTLLPELRHSFPDALVIGADRSEGMLSLADRRIAPVVITDARSLAFPAKTFDMVVMAFMLFHLPDAAAGLAEAHRVLRPSGCIRVSTWADDIASPAVSIWNEELDASGAPPCEALRRLAHHDLMDTTEKVERLLDAAGFVAARAEVHAFDHPMHPDDFVALRLGVGATSQRFKSLDENSQQRCLRRARARLSSLSPRDYTLRMRMILASADAP